MDAYLFIILVSAVFRAQVVEFELKPVITYAIALLWALVLIEIT